MKVNVVYGDEPIGENFLIEARRRGYSIDGLFNKDAESAAETFIDIAVRMDPLMGDDYYQNLGKLCNDLSKENPEFYEKLVEKVRRLDKELPARASLFLFGL